MAVTITSTLTKGLSSEQGASSTRSFQMPRIRVTATALLRQHGSSSINELRKQNGLRPACCLPEEVLRKVFLMATADGFDWPWINITYVCSTWRRVALSYQDLWSYIDFSHPKRTALTLQRAKLVPLCIRATVNPYNFRDLRRTLQLAHRINEITLTSSVHNIHPLLETLAHPNPALESLTVDIALSSQAKYGKVYDSPSFPTSGSPLPHLQYLRLRGAPLYLLSPRCINLTSLHLHDLPLSERPSRRHFLFMLGKFPLLQNLTLDCAFPFLPNETEVPDSSRRITLPNLITLTLNGCVQEVADALDSFIIPPTARVICRLCSLEDLKENIWKLSQAIGIHSWAAAEVAPLETLVISGNEHSFRFLNAHERNPEFRQSLRIRAYRADADYGGAAFDFTIGPDAHSARDDVMITTFAVVWRALSLTHIHTLALQNVDLITQKSWSQFLRVLPSLRLLDISGHAPSGVVWALLLNATAHSEEDLHAQRLFVPNLEDIYLHGVDCSSGGFMVSSAIPVNSHVDMDDSPFLDVLSVCLKERSKFGLHLRSLSISHGTYVLRNVVEDARKCVLHLVWDGRGVVKENEVDGLNPARYRNVWMSEGPEVQHYFRLKTLLEL